MSTEIKEKVLFEAEELFKKSLYEKSEAILSEIKDVYFYDLNFLKIYVEVLNKLEMWEDLLFACKALIELNDKVPSAYIKSGISYKKLNKKEQAEVFFLDAIEKFPSHIGAHVELIEFYIFDSQWEKVKNRSKIFTHLFPESDYGFIKLIDSCFELKEFFLAILIVSLNKRPNVLRNLAIKIESSKNEEVFYYGVLALLKEEQSYDNVTVICERYIYNKNNNIYAFERYNDIMSNLVDKESYLGVFLGLNQNPAEEMLLKIIETYDINIIKKAFSNQSIHIYNRINLEDLISSGKVRKNESLVYKHISNIYDVDSKYFQYNSNFLRKLKVAVCVSGQLRGFDQAIKTWGEMFPQELHQFDFYCCFWEKIGRSPLLIQHLSRNFSKKVSSLLYGLIAGMNSVEIEKKFPNLSSLLKDSDIINDSLIKKYYNPVSSKIIKDDAFLNKNSYYKMHFMIENAWSLIENPNEYDLIVRIRPDKPVNECNIDWGKIYTKAKEGYLISDSGPRIHPGAGMVIGDQIGISTPKIMRKYSTTYSSLKNRKGIYSEPENQQFTPHVSICLGMLEDNIKIFSLENVMSFGDLMNSSVISDEVALSALCKDLNMSSEDLEIYLLNLE